MRGSDTSSQIAERVIQSRISNLRPRVSYFGLARIGPVERARSQHCANQSAWANLGFMGAILSHAPIEPRAIAVSVATIHFDAACRYCRDGRRATTNIRPVDAIGRPMGDLKICAVHAGRLIERARANGLAVEMCDCRR